ncbi:MAG: hypothetical protein NT069_07045 [Planctomycetota bacterium]|nr:hypothetical protein [Planctomycetota bacterium]
MMNRTLPDSCATNPVGTDRAVPRSDTSRFAWNFARAGVVVALVLFTMAGTVHAAKSEADLREEKAKKIEALSSAEREQLKQNLKAFRELPESERQRVRGLHKQLEADSKAGGKLTLVLNNYYEWLKTLTPGQRSDLRGEADPVRRRQQVTDLLAKQQEAADPSNPKRRRMGLSDADLARVMPILERGLIEEGQLSESTVEDKKGLARYSAVLMAAFPADRRDPNPIWMKPELVNELLEALTEEDQKKMLVRDVDNRRRAGRLFFAIFTSVMAEFRKQANEIDRSKLEQFFTEMKGEQQDQIMRLPYDAQSTRLKQMYMRAHADEFPQPPSPPPWLNQVMRMGGRGPGDRPGNGFGPPNGFGPGMGPGPGGDGRPNGDPPADGDDRGPRRPGGDKRPRPRDKQRRPE